MLLTGYQVQWLSPCHISLHGYSGVSRGRNCPRADPLTHLSWAPPPHPPVETPWGARGPAGDSTDPGGWRAKAERHRRPQGVGGQRGQQLPLPATTLPTPLGHRGRAHAHGSVSWGTGVSPISWPSASKKGTRGGKQVDVGSPRMDTEAGRRVWDAASAKDPTWLGRELTCPPAAKG